MATNIGFPNYINPTPIPPGDIGGLDPIIRPVPEPTPIPSQPLPGSPLLPRDPPTLPPGDIGGQNPPSRPQPPSHGTPVPGPIPDIPIPPGGPRNPLPPPPMSPPVGFIPGGYGIGQGWLGQMLGNPHWRASESQSGRVPTTLLGNPYWRRTITANPSPYAPGTPVVTSPWTPSPTSPIPPTDPSVPPPIMSQFASSEPGAQPPLGTLSQMLADYQRRQSAGYWTFGG